ncbi:hypothetical protein SAMN02910265_03184, partial [Ruminococcus flavefaciens]
ELDKITYRAENLRLIDRVIDENKNIIFTFESNKSGNAYLVFDYEDDGKEKNASFEYKITDEEAPRENAPSITDEGYDKYKMYEPIVITAKNIELDKITYRAENLRLIDRVIDENKNIIFTFESNKSGNAYLVFDYEDDGKEKTASFEYKITDEEYKNNTVKGDANCDGTVDMGDVVLIMQALANPNKYGINGSSNLHITLQGIENGDVDEGVKGLTVSDALKIQRYLLGDEKSL